jgi:hypothetical protein
MVINDLLNRPLATDYRFAGARKVILRCIAGLLAGDNRLNNRVIEAAPLVVTQQGLQVPCVPILGAVLIDLFQLLKRLLPDGRQVLVFHTFSPLSAHSPS